MRGIWPISAAWGHFPLFSADALYNSWTRWLLLTDFKFLQFVFCKIYSSYFARPLKQSKPSIDTLIGPRRPLFLSVSPNMSREGASGLFRTPGSNDSYENLISNWYDSIIIHCMSFQKKTDHPYIQRRINSYRGIKMGSIDSKPKVLQIGEIDQYVLSGPRVCISRIDLRRI